MSSCYSHLNEADGPAFKMKNDPRLTTVGRFLRETNLDELPQLFNVLLVDMSLVGPRPPLPEEVKKYKPWQRKRLTVKPGLTCFWNLRGSHRLSFDEWVRSDIEYIKEKTFLLDIEILLLTFIFFIKYLTEERRKDLIGCLIFFALALFTKESAVFALPIMIFYFYFFNIFMQNFNSSGYRHKRSPQLVGYC